MPDYTYPGVYVEEIDTGNKPIEGVSTSVVGFFGVAERGPVTPQFISSFSDFVKLYGSYYTDSNNDLFYLAYAMDGFFQNGGQSCYIQRVVSGAATTLAASLIAGGLMVGALGPGVTGNRIAIKIEAGSLQKSTNDYFKLTVMYWSPSISVPGLGGVAGTLIDPTDPNNRQNANLRQPTLIETYDNLTAVSQSTNYYVTQVNGASTLIQLTQSSAATIPLTPLTPLQGGNDGATYVQADFIGDPTAEPGTKVGLAALEEIDEISLLCCPDENFFAGDTTITQAIVAQCESNQYRFAILQSPLNAPAVANHYPSVPSNYAAYYYPWIYVTNPETGISAPIPPGGHIAGIYARSDSTYNVAKDPANENILMIDKLQLNLANSQQGQLNPRGVNCLRYFKTSGNLVWGGRTTSTDPDWKYINVRRLFIYLEHSIADGTQWVVFQSNDDALWARVRRSVSDFLTTAWMQGLLMGQTKEQAFFVRCDRTTMTQADIDNGRLIMVIGVAPLKPAEFVIFQIGQWTGGTDVNEQ